MVATSAQSVNDASLHISSAVTDAHGMLLSRISCSRCNVSWNARNGFAQLTKLKCGARGTNNDSRDYAEENMEEAANLAPPEKRKAVAEYIGGLTKEEAHV